MTKIDYKSMTEENLTELRKSYDGVIEQNATNQSLIEELKIKVLGINKELNNRLEEAK